MVYLNSDLDEYVQHSSSFEEIELSNCYSLVQTVWGEQNNFEKYREYHNYWVALLYCKLLLYSVSLKNNHPELIDINVGNVQTGGFGGGGSPSRQTP